MSHTYLKKCAAFTDIHWGKPSPYQNQDCMNYVDWFCEQVKADPSIDHIVFMGDWFDHRSAIGIDTLNLSHIAARKINELGLPVFFIVGNHDLFHRHSRDVYSTIGFNEFDNFRVVNEPTVFPEMGPAGALVCPFLFHNEYPTLKQYINVPVWWGHFEFKGFVVTGHSMKMPTGPDVDDYAGPVIFSGHFHKRQVSRTTVYIGNTFPMNFADCDDTARGMCIYDYDTEQVDFIDWEECPKYQRVTLSDLIDNKVSIHQYARVRCVADLDISYEESGKIKQAFVAKYSLREFTLEEPRDLKDALVNGDDVADAEHMSMEEMIIDMLNSVEAPQIDKATLIDIYREISKQ